MARSMPRITILLAMTALVGCQNLGLGAPAEPAREPEAPRPPGATCAATRDCQAERVCVEQRCVAVASSHQGEILAAAAREEAEDGDFEAAANTYAAALDRYAADEVAAPPAVLCAAAKTALSSHATGPARERGAQWADRCLRESLVGSAARREVTEALAAQRHDGLDITAFGRDTPAEAFFTAAPSRPAASTVEVRVALAAPARSRGAEEINTALTGDGVRMAAADCFVQAWETSHAETQTAALNISVRTRLRDMGGYDLYRVQLSLTGVDLEADGFAPCVARAVQGAAERVELDLRSPTRAWEAPLNITASLP